MGLLDRLNNTHKYVLVRRIHTGSFRINATFSQEQMKRISNNTYFDESTFNGKDCLKVVSDFSFGSDNGIRVFFFRDDMILLYNDWMAAKG